MSQTTADVIRQHELQNLINTSESERILFASIARRIQVGATIEPGKWTFTPDPLESLRDEPPFYTSSQVCGAGEVHLVDPPSEKPIPQNCVIHPSVKEGIERLLG